jgi:ribosomal protein S18 acetylase RimI-like enzyme
MELVRLTRDDLAEFLALRTRGLIEEPMSFRVSARDDERQGALFWANRLANDIVLGVRRDGILVGIGGLSRFVGEKLQHKGLIWGMYIAPAERGGDVAKILMTGLLEAAKGYVTLLQLTLMASNERARRYYARYGFTLYAIEPQSVMTPDGPADEALMWRQVD